MRDAIDKDAKAKQRRASLDKVGDGGSGGCNMASRRLLVQALEAGEARAEPAVTRGYLVSSFVRGRKRAQMVYSPSLASLLNPQ